MKNANEVETLSDLCEHINSIGREDMWPHETITSICTRNGWIDCDSVIDAYPEEFVAVACNEAVIWDGEEASIIKLTK